MSPQIEIQLIAVVVAVACALPGVFLVLRRMAMLSDAISHAILLGIVLAFFITQDLSSPFLVLAATLTGVLTVTMVEMLNRTRLVKEDTAIGLVFPLLFSIGVILIARYAGKVHLDTDAVLLGELAFAPFDRLVLFGVDIGPKALYVMGGILALNLLFIVLFFKELKLATFDAQLAASLGFAPGVIHYSLMTLVSVTAVGAFEAVGSILVVALVIGPPATAYLLVDSVLGMLLLSSGVGLLAAISGYWSAHLFDVSIAGSMATMVGIIFFLTLLLAPQRGLIALARRRKKQQIDFSLEMLLVHLLNHEGMPEEEQECRIAHLPDHLHWEGQLIERVIKKGEREKLLQRAGAFLKLTEKGRKKAESSLTR
ncbi:ABC-type transporter, integral membrane subunit [Caldithrix abyssi DSM 13497]|uniref:ABC-type transporter, integral membrane subunit n=1 Tax=Caldithrix abyssi DSM 13497 TaxID=880073 RepID=H1XSH4_CALAY|nr:metal ABC transporter permease [Caldithrix abyssi]APF17257.1 manganese/zinc/iron transport system permease protein [Caldithrix abyssi DSM 13497]EHO41386.1 ABC-type transporter, integral membrane subunit [Caldithrix abyssi DSM 13497]